MNLDEFVLKLRNLSKMATPSSYFRVMSKERLLQRIKTTSNHQSIITVWQKMVASISLVALMIVFIFELTPPAIVNAYIGEATVLAGEMNIQRDTSLQKVQSSTKLQVGDTLFIPQQSKVEIRFVDDSKGTLFQNTVLRIDSFLFNAKNVKNSLIALTMQQGEMISTVEKQDGDLAKMQIQTPTSIIEAKNSDFKISVGTSGDTEVTALTNSVVVKATDTEKNANTKKVVAQAQVVQGYKAKLPNIKSSHKDPLEIVADETKIATLNNTNAEPRLSIDTSTQSRIISYLEIAQVKMYQALDMLNKGDTNKALLILKEYRDKLLIAADLLFNIREEGGTTPSHDISNILADSPLDIIKQRLGEIEDTTFQQQLVTLMSPLNTLEKSTKEKIVLSSVTVLSAPETTANDNVNGVEQEETLPADTALIKSMNGKLAYDTENIINLMQLRETISAEKQKDVDQLINTTILSIVDYINAIPDWKLQQKETRAFTALIPNDAKYENFLLKIRGFISDRVSFIITSKLRQLQ